MGTISDQSLRQMGRGRLSALDCREYVEGNAFPLFIHFAIPLRRIVKVSDKNWPLASLHFFSDPWPLRITNRPAYKESTRQKDP